MRYELVQEETDDCDWDLYDISDGKDCRDPGTVALVEADTEERFHCAHLCDVHGDLVLAEVNKGGG